MAKYKAYPEYKDSGVEWLNSTPAHWSKAPIKYLALAASSVFLDGDWIESKDLSDDGVRYITTGNIGEGFYKEQGSGFITEKTFNKPDCTEILEGDILISRLNKPIGRACLISELNFKTVTSVDNVIFRTDEPYNKKYLVYLFSSNYYFQHTGNLARGTTMQRISRGLLGNIRIPVPLLSEQVIITAFLDHETTKIDNLMEKQQQLIELLKEKRQAVISHAVTKGLNPDVPMKDSGIEWLGKIPMHWIVCHLKQLAKIRNGQDYKSIESETGFPVIGSGGQFAYAKNYMYDKPSVLLGRKGTIDKPLYMDSCFWVVDTMFYTEVNKNIIAKYLYYISSTIQFDKFSTNTALPSMTQENLGSFSLCYSLDPTEQQKILDFIDIKTKKIDTLIQKQLHQIDLLKERRTALISAAVTGKIDLRDWTPPASSSEASLAAEEATA
ncbi:restriction endonuclease subunit S [Enterobacter asburiae]